MPGVSKRLPSHEVIAEVGREPRSGLPDRGPRCRRDTGPCVP